MENIKGKVNTAAVKESHALQSVKSVEFLKFKDIKVMLSVSF